ncbi:phosphatidate cytidylyltransferase [Sphingorhabdus arenilitoris]|uniref:Phosphatidate cytidylyltransferase n=1 Tax=Sphingorhabdus arenilitoris TaxID=1490041 RepID=A0ABV8RES4_9SPHN
MSNIVKPKSDLKVRTLSAITMLIVAGTVIVTGGVLFTVFVTIIGAGLIYEFWGLVRKISNNLLGRAAWMLGGLIYIGTAIWQLISIRTSADGDPYFIFAVLGAVIAVDVGAYFAGRAIGGPKIAPKISPSKTWAGLFGGFIGASVVTAIYMLYAFGLFEGFVGNPMASTFWTFVPLTGLAIAVTAQAGDFFESWMKRRAGVKDSGNLIPGHGGLFDRVDGLLAILFGLSVINWLS